MTTDHKCLHEDKWDIVEDRTERIENKLDKLYEKLFDGNGAPAAIPDITRRLTVLEHDAVSRDDIIEMLRAFKVGKALCWAIGSVAALGAVATIFFHFFKPVAGR